MLKTHNFFKNFLLTNQALSINIGFVYALIPGLITTRVTSKINVTFDQVSNRFTYVVLGLGALCRISNLNSTFAVLVFGITRN